MTPSSHHRPRADRIAAQHKREAAFARVARVRGASVIGAGALTAAVAAVVSAVAPGHTLGKARTAVASTNSIPLAPSTGKSTATLPPLASPQALGLSSPDGAPQSAPQSAPSAPAPQSAPAQPSAPAPSAPVQQAAPTQSGPVVSGGS